MTTRFTSAPQRNNSTVMTDTRVNGRAVGFMPVSATITRRENEHDSASIFVSSRTAGTDFAVYPNQRLEFTYGTPGQESAFRGYVNTVMPQQRMVGTVGISTQEVAALGPTMVLKGNKPRFFTDMTLTEMMRQIVADSNLGFSDEFHNDTFKWRTLAQTSETDWEMLVALSNRLGAHLVYDRGVVRLIDYYNVCWRELPSKVFQSVSLPEQTTNAEIVGEASGAVLEYVPQSVSSRDPSYRTPTMSYLSGRTAVLMSPPNATTKAQPTDRNTWGSAFVSRFATDMPATSAQEAEILQGGFYNPDWTQEAKIRLLGDATIAPSMMVQVFSTARGLTLTPAYDGVWYVKEVEHAIGVKKMFYTTLTLGRVGQRGKNWYSPIPFWLKDSRGMPKLWANGAGQWMSNWR